MSKRINIGDNAFILPEPMTVIGTIYNGKPNFMAAAWVTRCNYKPCLMAICINKAHATSEAIIRNGEYSINLASESMLDKVDAAGLISGHKADKSSLFEVHYGELEKAPLVMEAPLSLEMKLHDKLELPVDIIFVGEVMASWTEEKYMTEGFVDVEKVRPYTLTMPDNRYWSVGRQIGCAWHDGRELKNTLK
ncbi:flavin reductase family protein [Salidesulfovibrio onnuriiensis]|uniref:flavin reductase family protein n=1 Tax=Salidesulfovibrio onnuriiensis TaxID=2583823 RepID=UPI0011CBA606|nr:flavin reductase family protein [Salidesulfovibrio onnuriiensis]